MKDNQPDILDQCQMALSGKDCAIRNHERLYQQIKAAIPWEHPPLVVKSRKFITGALMAILILFFSVNIYYLLNGFQATQLPPQTREEFVKENHFEQINGRALLILFTEEDFPPSN